jgi:fructuronate reductase
LARAVTGNVRTLPRLTSQTLSNLGHADVQTPAPGREDWSVGIVHLGIGAFHRAHQAVYTEDAAAATGATDWGILGVTQRSRTVVDQLRPQDGLYGVMTSAPGDVSLRVVGSVIEVAFPAEETARVLQALAASTTRVISLTITEKGYCRSVDGGLDLTNAAVQADVTALRDELAGDRRSRTGPPAPRTGIGTLARGLARRWREGGAPVTVVSCDNLVHNGQVAERLVHDAAKAAGGPSADDFRNWLTTSVRFPSTMVDRIVPATTADHHGQAEQMLGLHDAGLVVAEPFGQWVIEDRFATGRPAWEQVGATLAADVAPYETAKLRILNAAHSMLAYRGALAGHLTIAEAMTDPQIEADVTRLIDEDLIPTVPAPPGLDLGGYRDDVLERFRNPATGHSTVQVAMDGSQKLPIRLLGAASERLSSGQVPTQIAAAVAAWMAYVTAGEDRHGRDLPLNDPAAAAIKAATDGPGGDAVDKLLNLNFVFPRDLAADAGFRRAVRGAYTQFAG